MTLVIDVSPEPGQRLQDEADKRGLPVVEYARKLIEEQLGVARHGDTKAERSLLKLEGLGAELWQAIDAQHYVNSLRDESNHRA